MTQLVKKSILARLLANENISVEQTNHHTAFFDVDARVLGLPHLKDIDNNLYDLFVGHEVGHALETPADGWHSCTTDIPGCPRDYVNIVEDIRIEKLILKRYPGLLGSFMRGYQNLLDRDFFGLSTHPVETLPFMDRLNVFSKSRGLVSVSFSKKEQPYVDMAMAVETWDDVIATCRAIYEFVKDAKRAQDDDRKGGKKALPKKIIVKDAKDAEGGTGEKISDEEMKDLIEGIENGSIEVEHEPSSEEGCDKDSDSSEEGSKGPSTKGSSDEDSDEDGEETESSGPTAGSNGNIEDSITDKLFRNNYTNKLVDSVATGSGNLYVKGPTKQIAKECITSYEEVKASRVLSGAYRETFPTDKYTSFVSETSKTVMVMVKEFEMRKAAFRSARARVSTKGSLDVNQLHKYQYDDQLFRQVTYLADAQSHGMIMLIDYSGSMSSVIGRVIKQLLVTISFCKRVGIPFEVYGFTSGNSATMDRASRVRGLMTKLTAVSLHNTHIFKLISSDMSKTNYTDAYRMLFAQSNGATYSPFYGRVEQLGGTPLNSALLVMMHTIKQFKEKHRVQKMNFITLTDGQSEAIHIATGIDGGLNSNVRKTIVDMGFTKIEQSQSRFNEENTTAILNAIRADGVRTMNYFLDNSRSIVHYSNGQKYLADIRANGVATIDNSYGYDRRFFIVSNGQAMANSVGDLNVASDMSASQVAKNFSKHSTSKKNIRVIAAKFAEVVS